MEFLYSNHRVDVDRGRMRIARGRDRSSADRLDWTRDTCIGWSLIVNDSLTLFIALQQ